MGLDIHVISDNYEQLYSSDEESKYSYLHSLSRTFCYFMGRKNIVKTPELDQIGKLIGINILPLYEMETYSDDLDWLEFMDSEEEKQNIILKNNRARENIDGNIDKIIDIVHQLTTQLYKTDNLILKIWDNDHDTLGNGEYFSEFESDLGDGYIGNNLGHDLRNLQRFLEFAKNRGANTVWFSYG